MLLEAKIVKDDGYQKQQDTLIVWTDTNGVDMALSFQEADGCAVIWFVSSTLDMYLFLTGMQGFCAFRTNSNDEPTRLATMANTCLSILIGTQMTDYRTTLLTA